MSLLTFVETNDCSPDHCRFVIQDERGREGAGPPVGEPLALGGMELRAPASLVRAGDGWLDVFALDDMPHSVRVEVHDGPPGDDDPAAWDDVQETPFASYGLVARHFDYAAGPVELGPPGFYRVRVSSRPVPGGMPFSSRFHITLWPVEGPPEPPRRLRRSRPVLDGERNLSLPGIFGGVRLAVTEVAMLTAWAAESSTPVTVSWLADRLLTDPASVRGVLAHPEAGDLIDGLDAPDGPLTVRPRTARPPLPTKAVPAPVRTASRGVKATPARRATPARSAVPKMPAVPKVRAVPAVRKVPPDQQQGE